MSAPARRRQGGFTLIEVLVALVIVAFGMSALLAALSSSADNISALREKTLAEWVGLNQIADARLLPNAPQLGSTEGDVKGFGNGNWHWRRDVIAVTMIPGMVEIAVRVRRLPPGSASSSGGDTNAGPSPPSTTRSSSGVGGSSSGSSSGYGSSGLGPLGASQALKQLGATKLPATKDDQQWLTTVIGFRGDSVGAPTGVEPDWSACNTGSTTGSAGICAASSSSGGASSSSSSGTNTTPVNGIATPNSGSSGGITPPITQPGNQ